MQTWVTRAAAIVASAVLLGAAAPATASADVRAAVSPLDDSFYTYSGATPLARLAPGTPLKQRTVTYQVQGIPLPLQAQQILFRTADAQGRADTGVTTVVRPPVSTGATTPKVVSYESFYDSLNPEDEPSAAIAGGQGMGKGIVNAETALIQPLLLSGYTINIPDTEGQKADFAAGPEYGVVTVDSLTAVSKVASTGVGTRSKIGLIGYSGGAIAGEWAAELAPKRAPAIAKRIVGTAIGGVLVKPSTNLHYVEGSSIWSGVIPMALIGIARAYDIDLAPYTNAYGKLVLADLQRASIGDTLGHYPGLTWKSIADPKYPTPESVPVYVRNANKLIMGTGGTPTAPLFIGQGTRGELEGTQASPVSGAGDGVMVAGDVRSLARKYCGKGVTVRYQEYPLSHTTTAAAWLPDAVTWLQARFGGTPAPNTCAAIAPGNSLAPITVQR